MAKSSFALSHTHTPAAHHIQYDLILKSYRWELTVGICYTQSSTRNKTINRNTNRWNRRNLKGKKMSERKEPNEMDKKKERKKKYKLTRIAHSESAMEEEKNLLYPVFYARFE